jgi:hypothetical protein
MKNRHRVSQVVSKAYLRTGCRRKMLKPGLLGGFDMLPLQQPWDYLGFCM